MLYGFVLCDHLSLFIYLIYLIFFFFFITYDDLCFCLVYIIYVCTHLSSIKRMMVLVLFRSCFCFCLFSVLTQSLYSRHSTNMYCFSCYCSGLVTSVLYMLVRIYTYTNFNLQDVTIRLHCLDSCVMYM